MEERVEMYGDERFKDPDRVESEYPVEELVVLVGELAEKYTGGESSSITYEKAQQLMEAVKYCIHEYGDVCNEMMEHPDASASATALRQMRESPRGAREAYERGYHIVLNKTARFRDIYHELIRNFDSYGNRCLEETVMRGMPGFLQWYDSKFGPQETILTLDYPVLKDLNSVTGIDAVLEYGRCIAWEQSFLRSFKREWVRRSLGAHNHDPAEMIENLCSVLLPDIIGHVVLKKSWQSAGYSPEEYQILTDGFSGLHGSELETYLYRILSGLASGIFLNDVPEDRSAVRYICGAVPDLAARIRNGIRFGCLDRVFMV